MLLIIINIFKIFESTNRIKVDINIKLTNKDSFI